MKKLLIMIAAFFGITAYGAEVVTNYSDSFVHAPVEKYPASISFMNVEDVLKKNKRNHRYS